MVDTIGVAVEHLQVDFDFLTNRKVSGHNALGDLAEDDDALGFKLDCGERVRLERLGGYIGGRRGVMVLGIGPHLSFAGKGSGLKLGAIAVGAGAGAGAGREHNGAARSALGADEGVGLGGGEPAFDRRNSFCGCHALQCSCVDRGGLIPEENLALAG